MVPRRAPCHEGASVLPSHYLKAVLKRVHNVILNRRGIVTSLWGGEGKCSHGLRPRWQHLRPRVPPAKTQRSALCLNQACNQELLLPVRHSQMDLQSGPLWCHCFGCVGVSRIYFASALSSSSHALAADQPPLLARRIPLVTKDLGLVKGTQCLTSHQ